MTPRYLTTTEAAAYLGRTVPAIKMLVYRGLVPHQRVGRRLSFDRERLDRWMTQHTRGGGLARTTA